MKIIDIASREVLGRLHNYGLPMANMFTLEVLLCNYRQSYGSGKLYPGRTHDTEDRYLRRILSHWDDDLPLDFYDVRADIFPHEHLCELHNNWNNRFEDGVRSKDIGGGFLLRRKGFVWSDLLYDYNATVEAGLPFDEPLEWPDIDERLDYAFELRERAIKHD